MYYRDCNELAAGARPARKSTQQCLAPQGHTKAHSKSTQQCLALQGLLLHSPVTAPKASLASSISHQSSPAAQHCGLLHACSCRGQRSTSALGCTQA